MENIEKHVAVPRKGHKINIKQKKFCHEYLKDLNATNAAIRTGYSKNSAARFGVQLLNTLVVAQYLQKIMLAQGKRNEVTADKVVQQIAKSAYDDIGNYLEYKTVETKVGYNKKKKCDIFGYKTVITMKDSKLVDTSNIEQISIAADGTFKFKLYSRSDALIQLGRHLGLFTDNININADIQVGVCNSLQPQNRKVVIDAPEIKEIP